MKNEDYKTQIILENYNSDGTMTIREYVEREAENDPGFFRWLFDDSELDDFGSGMTDEQKEEYKEWLETL